MTRPRWDVLALSLALGLSQTLLVRPGWRVIAKVAEPSSTDLQEAGRLKQEISRLQREGRFDQAIVLAERVVAITQAAMGADNLDVLKAAHTLAALYTVKGDHSRAAGLYERVFTVMARTMTSDDPLVAATLSNVAILYRMRGDYDRAEQLHKRALAIRLKSLGPDDPQVAESMWNLASVLDVKGQSERAMQEFRGALDILEKALGPEHPRVASYLRSLARVHSNKEDHATAMQLLRRVVSIEEKALGREHIEVAQTLMDLGALALKRRDRASAIDYFSRALRIHETVLGQRKQPMLDSGAVESIEVYGTGKGSRGAGGIDLHQYSTLQEIVARLAPLQSLALSHHANQTAERSLEAVLATGSEAQKRTYMATFMDETGRTVSLHTRRYPDEPIALRLALTTILRRKGRVLDAMIDTMAALRGRLAPEDQVLIDELTRTRSLLAALSLQRPAEIDRGEHLVEMSRLETETQKLEADISSRSGELLANSQAITLEAIQATIPERATLVELVWYRAVDPQGTGENEQVGEARYVAYLLRRKGNPTWIDLGAAAPIDEEATHLRRALADPERQDVGELARSLDEKVMRPIRRKMLTDTRLILLSPDAGLNLIPFGALVDEKKRLLVERYSFTYLPTGRDLLRLQAPRAARDGPLVVGSPLFDGSGDVAEGQSVVEPAPGGERSADLNRVAFGPLPGTVGEVEALRRILPGAEVLTGAAATESALKEAHGPSILHVATHGFFLADQPYPASAARGFVQAADGPDSRPPARFENPLLRSGLALAGANRLRSGEEDGVLTALEAAGLDLWGTRLVVLSACETGVGAVRNGEGVYGLRRALSMAGAESQTMSLWKVDDEATRDLMVAYYGKLLLGEGRAEALRQAQLEMLRRKDRSHPFYWAGFIPSGAWSGIDILGRGARLPAHKVAPSLWGSGSASQN